MAELADALDLGSSVSDVQVQVLLSALKGAKLNCDGSGFAPFCVLTENSLENKGLPAVAAQQ